MSQNRFKSKVVWISVISLIILLFGNYGLYDILKIDESTLEKMLNTILSILIGFGVINNPTKGDEF